MNQAEFAGACFDPDGHTLDVNQYGARSLRIRTRTSPAVRRARQASRTRSGGRSRSASATVRATFHSRSYRGATVTVAPHLEHVSPSASALRRSSRGVLATELRRHVISLPCGGLSPGRSLRLGPCRATPALSSEQSGAGSLARCTPKRAPSCPRHGGARGTATCRRNSDSALHRPVVDDGRQYDVPAESRYGRSDLNPKRPREYARPTPVATSPQVHARSGFKTVVAQGLSPASERPATWVTEAGLKPCATVLKPVKESGSVRAAGRIVSALRSHLPPETQTSGEHQRQRSRFRCRDRRRRYLFDRKSDVVVVVDVAPHR